MVGKRLPALLVFVLVVNAGLVGCASTAGGGRVTILGPWVGPEEGPVLQMLSVFEQRTGIDAVYVGTPAVDQVLQAAVQQGSPPDVAVLPSLGDTARYKEMLKRLDGVVRDEWANGYSQQWRDLARAGIDGLYAVPAQANLKGMAWVRGKLSAEWVPPTLEELTTHGQAGGARRWCMGVYAGPTSGWPGTDWIETLLLRQSGGEVYQRWATGDLPWTSPEVRQAWATWGQMHGGSAAALLTDFTDAGQPMFADPPGCLMEHQGSFISGFYSGYHGTPQRDTDFDFFLFPTSRGAGPTGEPRAVAADMASMFNDTPEAQEFIRFLVSAEGQRQWPAAGMFSASSAVTDDYSEFDKRIAAELTGPAPLCFDASDLMPTAMRGAFYRAVLEYLSDPGRLDPLLDELEQVRTGLREQGEPWLTVACEPLE